MDDFELELMIREFFESKTPLPDLYDIPDDMLDKMKKFGLLRTMEIEKEYR